MRSKEWFFLDTKGQRRSFKDAIKVARRRPPDRKKCTRRKNEKRKGKNNCSNTAPWILEVFVAANPRLEVVLSSVDGPPELELGFDFYGTWRPEAGGRPESPCARPQLEKKKDALESERAGGCRRKWGGHTASLNVSTSL